MHMGTSRMQSMTAAFLAGGLVGLWAAASIAASQYTVSQMGREFTPNEVTLQRSEAITIVNDDGDLRHHVYIDADKFTFDSGDQEPGSKINITFPIQGTFEVLCAIHPKMKLIVRVK